MKKYFSIIALSFTLLFANTLFVFGEVIEKGDYTAKVNGTPLTQSIYENKDHAHMFPLREMCNLLGYTITWQTDTKTAIVTGNGIIAEVQSGNTTVLVDKDMVFDLKAEIENKNDTLYVPSLFFTEIFPITMKNEPNEVILVETVSPKTSEETHSTVGIIQDATMNTISIKTIDTDTVYTFYTESADTSQCKGLHIGSQVTITYRGDLNTPDSNIEVISLSQ